VAVRLPEVFVGGEGLARGPADVLGTLLHEAAHALAHVRGIKDTSRQGRWHNARFKALAEEIGIQVTRDASIGWSPLHLERFRPKEGALDGANQPFEVELDASGISVTVGADETMAEAIEAAGVDLPTFCREGTCGTCETYVLVTSLSVSCRRFCSLGSPPVQPPHEQLPVAAGAQCDDRTGTPGSLPARNHPGGSPGGRRGGEGPAPAPLADRRAPSNASLDQLLDRYLATLDVTS
jgi:hypothetical protein